MMNRREFLKAAGSLGLASCLGVPFTSREAKAFTDALVVEAKAKVNTFADWCVRTGHRGYLAEIGVTTDLEQDYADYYLWRNLLAAVLRDADSRGLLVTIQQTTEQSYADPRGGFGTMIYLTKGDRVCSAVCRVASPGDGKVTQAAVIEQSPSVVGFNIGGSSRCNKVSNSDTDWINYYNKGTYGGPMSDGNSYWYPATIGQIEDPTTGMNTWEYLASRGHAVHRLGFRWERIQNRIPGKVNGGPLDETEISRLKTSVARARAARQRIILSLQNSGAYYYTSGRAALGSQELPYRSLGDVWKRLIKAFSSEIRLGTIYAIDLMNEPMSDRYGIYPGNNVDMNRCALNWQTYSKNAVAQIRAAGYGGTIFVSVYKGTDFHPSGFWFSRRADPRVRPTKNIYFDHQAGGKPGGGKYANTYAWEVAQVS